MTIFLLIRLTDLVQLGIAAPEGLHKSTMPSLDLAMMVLYAVESILLTMALIRAGRFASVLWATVDLVTAAAIITSQMLFTAEVDRIGTWVAWGFAIGVGTSVAVGIGYPHRWQTVCGVGVLIICYVAVSLPAGLRQGTAGTVLSNAFAFVGFGVFGRGAAGYLRRLGRDADAARQQAADNARQQAAAAAEVVFDRQRHLLHDQAGVLRQLANPETDPQLEEVLRERARTAALQIRQWLSMSPVPDRHEVAGLVGLLRLVVQEANDLAITTSLDLAAEVVLDARTAEAVRSAVFTLLDNVREHARAEEVLVHADSRADGRWEVTIRDDGVGFDHRWDRVGFGLGMQVRMNLERVGAQVAVQSAVGAGTCVVITGPQMRAGTDAK